MSALRVEVSRDRCVGAGQCVRTVPEVFDQSEADGLVVLLNATPSGQWRARLDRAALLCPARAIRVIAADHDKEPQ